MQNKDTRHPKSSDAPFLLFWATARKKARSKDGGGAKLKYKLNIKKEFLGR
jgi:hypothetical protein